MSSWAKWPEEELLVGRDWTDDLGGATLQTVIDPDFNQNTLTCKYHASDGNITKYWLKGGQSGATEKVTISVRTTDGELLSDHVDVRVKE